MRDEMLLRRHRTPASQLRVPGFRSTIRRRVPAIIVLLALVVGPPVGHAEIIDRILGVVNSRVITLSDVRAFMELGLVPADQASSAEERVVTGLIQRELILAEVQRYVPPTPDDATVRARVEAMRARFETPGAFQAALQAAGLSDARLRAIVRDTLWIERYLDERFGFAAQPTEEEVGRYYREHEARFTRGGQVVPFAEVQDLARQQLAAERRETLIAEWLAGLERRADVIRFDTTR